MTQQATIQQAVMPHMAGGAQVKSATHNGQPPSLSPANRATLHPRYAANRATLHPRYVERRKSDGRSLAQHALGTLLVLGALVLMANA